MARKSKGGAGRRPGQQRPRSGTPPRRVETTTAAAEPTLEERLAELEAERDRLLAAARGMVDAVAPADAGEAEEDADAEPEEVARPVAAATAPRPRPTATVVPPSVSGARRIGRVVPTGATASTAAAVAKAPPRGVSRAADSLDPEDPSIPLERVPYVRADLRRVGVIAGLMIVLIVIADIVVRAVVK
jgi:hypothetical protein